MTGAVIYVTAGFILATALLVYSTVKYARLEMAYDNLRRVNNILRQRLANSEERPF
jgi:hypothetical protein